MARKKICRKIQTIPAVEGYRPISYEEMGHIDEIIMSLEEYEAIKLCDYEQLTQAESAKVMGVSRPTFTRVYETARRKVAKSFVEGRVIRFKGGDYESSMWNWCNKCKLNYSIVEDGDSVCPVCNPYRQSAQSVSEEVIICCESDSQYELSNSGFGRSNCLGSLKFGKEIIDFETNKYANEKSNAGIKSAEYIKEKGCKLVVANHFGTKVDNYFREKGVQMVIPSDNNSLKQIVGKYRVLKANTKKNKQ